MAAFEQRLGKKIFVSPYCHLTGALGVALLLREEKPFETGFTGTGFYKETVELSSEKCTFCNNHCHISLATVNGEQEAYGFLCGRDYETKKHVAVDSRVFNLLERRERYFKHPGLKPSGGHHRVTGSLHLFEELPSGKGFSLTYPSAPLPARHIPTP